MKILSEFKLNNMEGMKEGWMDGWVGGSQSRQKPCWKDGWMEGSQSRAKDCLQQSKMWLHGYSFKHHSVQQQLNEKDICRIGII